MSQNPLRLQFLFEKYAAGAATPAELEEFWQLFRELDDADTLPEAMKDWWGRYEGEFDLSRGVDGEKTLRQVLAAGREKTPDYIAIHRKPLHRRLWAAAAVLFVIFAGAAYFYFTRPAVEDLPIARVQNPAFKNDVPPGRAGATLTLADGAIVDLDSAGNRVLANQEGSQVTAQNGTITYNGQAGKPVFNTLTTQRGQQYSVRLPDNSLVILDAASSIRYPVTFTGNERRVEITGQAWFEVTSDPAKPFLVQKGDKTIQVLGTHFNVNAYDDEADMKVTLVEGSVKVSNGGVSNMLKPGQQAVLGKSDNNVKVISNADMEQALAWKNGQFAYESTDIDQIMRDAARWYNIEVVYESGIPQGRFTGGITRSATLTELLTILEMSRVRFRLEGRVLTVAR
jgi:ferric-dicitrate binding protein FerR (iron transport regulator)